MNEMSELALASERAVEEAAYESLKELLETAFRKDGFLEVMKTARDVVEEYANASAEAEKNQATNTHSIRTNGAAYLFTTHIPKLNARIREE